MKQEQWYVGQKVWDEVFKPELEGVIVDNKFSTLYPLCVEFEDGMQRTYTFQGSYASEHPSTLKPYPHRIEIHRIEPEFEKGQIVLMRHYDNAYWLPARYIRKNYDGNHYLSISNPVSEGLYTCEIIPFAGNEHLLLTTDMP